MTSLIAKLGYVGVTTPRFEEMRTWGPEVLGCMLGPDGADGAVRLKIDDADYRLSFHPGDEYKMAYTGWEVLSHRDLDAAIKRLEDNGAKSRVADEQVATERVTLRFADGSADEADVLIGADGINSLVRRTLWGDTPIREHRLHVIGGFTFADLTGAEPGMAIIGHGRSVQGSWTSIRYKGRDGHQWWVLEACDPDAPAPADLLAHAKKLGAPFPHPLPELINHTDPGNVQRWVIRDRGYLGQWSKGRITLAGDAAHATSPYAAYGAGMAIEDGYFIGRALRGIDLADSAAVARALQAYEDPRKPHTESQVKMAYQLGRIFHHTPRLLQPTRDLVFDHTPFLQKVAGDTNPREINKQLALIVD